MEPRVEIWNGREWEPCEFKDIKAGMTLRAFNSQGEMLTPEEGALATCDAYKDEDGSWSVTCIGDRSTIEVDVRKAVRIVGWILVGVLAVVLLRMLF